MIERKNNAKLTPLVCEAVPVSNYLQKASANGVEWRKAA